MQVTELRIRKVEDEGPCRSKLWTRIRRRALRGPGNRSGRRRGPAAPG